ncbi:MAG: preprotein translocase subunit SecY [Coriobacteriia bacterium]|nr:preprotein translocase subunit SecY [Coriobacteriia bacterium]
MLEALANAFRIPDLRKKILFTIGMIALYRVGAHIPVPGVTNAMIDALTEAAKNSSALGLLNLFAGGAMQNFAIFALGIMPYITSSIIMQLLQAVIPRLEQWSKEGESGQRKIIQITRYMTLGLGLFESVGLIATFQSTLIQAGALPTTGFDWLTRGLILVTLMAGTAFIMWMGELITQRGIGNGMSLLIFANIVSRFPITIIEAIQLGQWYWAIAIMVAAVGMVAAIVTMERGQRRIPVQYAKRVVGRKVFGGVGTYIPLKVNSANVIPIIFASSILYFPTVIAGLSRNATLTTVANTLASGPLKWTLTAVLIVFFAYFYTALVFNPIDLADNLRKQGGFIPGVRPGKATSTYIENVLNRITLPGAMFLAAIAIVPTILFEQTQVSLLQQFGGTSILIMVGVALETMTQLESQLKMRHYDGFFK